jgi:hypothetical protein
MQEQKAARLRARRKLRRAAREARATGNEGLECTTQENNEGGLVAYTCQSRMPNGDRRESAATAFALHYYKSAPYEPPVSPVTPLSPEHLTPLSNNSALLLAELKRINKFVQVL